MTSSLKRSDSTTFSESLSSFLAAAAPAPSSQPAAASAPQLRPVSISPMFSFIIASSQQQREALFSRTISPFADPRKAGAVENWHKEYRDRSNSPPRTPRTLSITDESLRQKHIAELPQILPSHGRRLELMIAKGVFSKTKEGQIWVVVQQEEGKKSLDSTLEKVIATVHYYSTLFHWKLDRKLVKEYRTAYDRLIDLASTVSYPLNEALSPSGKPKARISQLPIAIQDLHREISGNFDRCLYYYGERSSMLDGRMRSPTYSNQASGAKSPEKVLCALFREHASQMLPSIFQNEPEVIKQLTISLREGLEAFWQPHEDLSSMEYMNLSIFKIKLMATTIRALKNYLEKEPEDGAEEALMNDIVEEKSLLNSMICTILQHPCVEGPLQLCLRKWFK